MPDTAYREFVADRVDVQRLTPCREAISVRTAFEERFGREPENRGGWFHPADWGRTTCVLGRLEPGAKVLDVGVGAGQFVNMLAASGKFDEVTGLDRTRFNKYSEFHPIRRFDGSVAELPFPDDEFDSVTCMEVLEHVPAEVLEAGLGELRRVCGRQLLMTVPYDEPEPMSKGHVRRFTDADLVEMFPHASFTILDRPRKPWVLIEERFDDAGRPIAVDPSRQRIAQLEREIARLRERRSLRAADWVGWQWRRARRKAVALVRSLRR